MNNESNSRYREDANTQELIPSEILNNLDGIKTDFFQTETPESIDHQENPGADTGNRIVSPDDAGQDNQESKSGLIESNGMMTDAREWEENIVDDDAGEMIGRLAIEDAAIKKIAETTETEHDEEGANKRIDPGGKTLAMATAKDEERQEETNKGSPEAETAIPEVQNAPPVGMEDVLPIENNESKEARGDNGNYCEPREP